MEPKFERCYDYSIVTPIIKMNSQISTHTRFAPGDFSWINICPTYQGTGYGKEADKEMFTSAYAAINSIDGAWEFMKNDEPSEGGYMFGKHKNAEMRNKIDQEILKGYGGHSGGSYGMTMRRMQFIAKKGWEAFIRSEWQFYNPEDEKVMKCCRHCKGDHWTLCCPLKPCGPPPEVIITNPIMEAIHSNPPNLDEFLNRLENIPGIREHIPDLDDQVSAIREFQEGKISYSEMRARSG